MAAVSEHQLKSSASNEVKIRKLSFSIYAFTQPPKGKKRLQEEACTTKPTKWSRSYFSDFVTIPTYRLGPIVPALNCEEGNHRILLVLTKFWICNKFRVLASLPYRQFWLNDWLSELTNASQIRMCGLSMHRMSIIVCAARFNECVCVSVCVRVYSRAHSIP